MSMTERQKQADKLIALKKQKEREIAEIVVQLRMLDRQIYHTIDN